jgi:hypothetical protein
VTRGERDPRAGEARSGGRRSAEESSGWDPNPRRPDRGRSRADGRADADRGEGRPARERVRRRQRLEEELELEEVPEVPVRRLLSVAIAGFSILLAFGLIIGAQANRAGFSVVMFGAQALFVLAWTAAARPPRPIVVGGIGLASAIAADIAVNIPVQPSLTPLGYVIAASFAAAVVSQLAVRHRAGVTEALGVSMTIVIGVNAFAALIVLSRLKAGTQVLDAGLLAAGVAIAVARICDVIVPSPRLAPQVPRGAVGVVVGAMLGTTVGVVVGYFVDGLSPEGGAAAGMAAALVAVVVDLGIGYAEAGRRLEGEAPSMWIARHMQGPLGAFALAAPAAYVVGIILN